MSSLIGLPSEKTIKQNDDDDDDDSHKFMEITLVADKDTILHHGDDTATHLLMLANLVSLCQSPSCWIVVDKTYCADHEMVCYPEDNAIHHLNIRSRKKKNSLIAGY